jgi:cyclopropane fatty-acyl-phospholipid synthase-like methyltransferase
MFQYIILSLAVLCSMAPITSAETVIPGFTFQGANDFVLQQLNGEYGIAIKCFIPIFIMWLIVQYMAPKGKYGKSISGKHIRDFIKCNDGFEGLESRYSGDRVAVGHFVQDYMNERINITCSFDDIMTYKDDIFTWNFTAHHFYFLLTRFLPEILIHSQEQDERIIRSHYDDKNDLFSWFLGPRMIYTSCYFLDPSESLEKAQDNKMDIIAHKMQLKEGETLLDIGCGWGTLITHMAKHYGCKTTGVTIAESGAKWARSIIKENGMEGQSNVLRMDYRDIPRGPGIAKYNKISCLEMAEHVGVKNFRTFMEQCYEMLDDNGIFYIQIACLRERDSLIYGDYKQEDIVWGLFMNEYIFSGADASMPVSWDLVQIEKAGFEVHSIENVGIHYSKTINFWYHNWISNKEKVLKKYGESCYREYLIFLGWSTEIARQGSSTAYQIVCHKNTNTMDRPRYIGKVNLGDNEKAVYGRKGSVSSKKTTATLAPSPL